jgi:FlaG/FlaF family flagellin (archaellin)
MSFPSLDDLWGDMRAVTPVIGVVLMLALTVTMMAVAVPLVLTQTDQVADSQPDVDIAFAYSEDVDSGERDVFDRSGSAVGADGQFTLIFESGESVSASQLNITGAASSGNLASDNSSYSDEDDISPGAELTVWANRGETIRLIWSAPGEDEGAVLGTFTIRPTS